MAQDDRRGSVCSWPSVRLTWVSRNIGDGQIVAEIKSVDVYDPTTGQIRSVSTDDIACWFIATDYNGENFFVRHAYFTGAEEPYQKLKRALRAEIDEALEKSLQHGEPAIQQA